MMSMGKNKPRLERQSASVDQRSDLKEPKGHVKLPSPRDIPKFINHEKETGANNASIRRRKMAEADESWWRTSTGSGLMRFKGWEYFKDYSSNTSIHGVKYIAEDNRSIIEKIFWIIFFLMSIALCSHLIYKVWMKWTYSPVIVSFNEKTTPVWEIPFPAVTICSETKVRQTIFNFTDAIWEYTNWNTTECWTNYRDAKKFDTLDKASLLCDKNYITGENFTNEDAITEFRNLAPTQESLLMFARWRNTDINVTLDFFAPTLTEEGICYSFNMLDPKDMFTEQTVQSNYSFMSHNRSSYNWSLERGYEPESPVDTFPNRALGVGYNAGLVVLLRSFTRDIDYLCKGAVQGFKILLHNPTELPQVSQTYLRADLNQELVVAIKPTMMTTNDELRHYSPHRRQCFFPSERSLNFFKVYTQNNCQQECLSNISFSLCGCVGFYMPRSADRKICASAKRECLEEASALMLKNEVKTGDGEGCDCLPACTGLRYEGETSTAYMDWVNLVTAYKVNLSSDEYEGANIGRVVLFFKESQFITSRRGELYGITDFLANCGGLLGLFMGISVLSMIEIAYYLTLRLCCDPNMKLFLKPKIHTYSSNPSSPEPKIKHIS